MALRCRGETSRLNGVTCLVRRLRALTNLAVQYGATLKEDNSDGNASNESY